MKHKLLKYLARFLALFPSKLPVSGLQFKSYAERVLWAYDLPDRPSYHAAIASMMMRLGPTEHRKPKKYFAKAVLKAMANEIAYGVIQLVKEEEDKAAAAAKKQQEETAKNVESSSDGDKLPGSGVQAASA